MKAVKTSPKNIRILIVDDHPMTRHGLVHLICDQPDLVVCGQAEAAGDALTAVLKSKPDLVLADITLPDKSGIELIKDIKAVLPQLPILIISMHDETLYAERALKAGAAGYIMKVAGGEKLMEAIRHVLSGKVYVSETVSARILMKLSGKPAGAETGSVEMLTDRELEVFNLIGQGLATKEMGERLHLSSKTIEAHRLNIKAKLGISSAPELISFAARWTALQSGQEKTPVRA